VPGLQWLLLSWHGSTFTPASRPTPGIRPGRTAGPSRPWHSPPRVRHACGGAHPAGEISGPSERGHQVTSATLAGARFAGPGTLTKREETTGGGARLATGADLARSSSGPPIGPGRREPDHRRCRFVN